MPVPLPDRAVQEPIALETARGLGLTRHELNGPLWQLLGRGVRGWCGLDARDPMTRIRAVAAQLPAGVAVGGWAALKVHGVHDVDGTSGPGGGRQLPVLVQPGPRSRVRPRPGIVVDRSALSATDLTEVDGILVASAVRGCFDVMRRDGVEEGLVAGDAAGRMIGLAPEDVRSYVETHPRLPGVPRARVCAALLDPRAASNPESRLRYVWLVEAGLPPPLVNPAVVDDWGRLLGMPDLLDDAAGFVVEYDGAHHRDLRRHTADNAREERLERAGLIVVRATAIDLWPRRSELVQRLRDGHARGLARDRDKDRWGLRR
jgi:hypothetical protein